MAHTVLLIDRDEDTRDILRTVLEHHGYGVEVATIGDEGVHLARHIQPDMIVLEYPLPQQDGVPLLERFRNEPVLREVPLLVVTSHGILPDTADPHRIGRELCLTKPIFPGQVLRVVDQLIGRAMVA